MSDSPPLLVVDDTPENLVAVVAALEPLGRRIVTASSGEEALRQLLVEDFSLVVLDVQMPGIDGFETARAIKGRERTRDIPILFLTAISREDEHRLAGYETGAVDYLFKPISPELLRAKATVFVQLDAQRRLLLAQRAELERKTEALEQSNRDLEQFSYIASHDLQEPLRVVSGYLEMVLDSGGALADDARDWITRASAATKNMSDLVRDLLSYARAGLSTAPSETVDVRAALDTAIENLSLAIADTGATIVVAPDLPKVTANHRELVQVLQNLVGNALRHRAEHAPVVELFATSDDGVAEIVVCDNGPGVPEDQLASVFGLFERIEGSPYPGTGVGLAICRRVVEHRGGRIWMERNDGLGVSVHVRLPVAAPTQ